MTDNASPLPDENLPDSEDQVTYYTRFDLGQRISHLVMLVSFTVLGITGLAQKFIESPISLAIFNILGGIEVSRIIHRAAAVGLMVVSVYHIIDVLYRVIVLRSPWTMMPVVSDLVHVIQDISYYLGIRKKKAYYGRFSYVEKAEYLALVWGTVLMGITGFMMWNPIASARWLPGEAIPAAKAAHGGEAILAVLAILIWHVYHVHIKLFNKSMFTGKLSEAEMVHEHPSELEEIKQSSGWKRPQPDVIRKRQRVFFPIAAVLTVLMGLGIVAFTTGEQTALETVPRGESAQVFVPLTPTPRPTLAPTATPEPVAGVATNSWQGSIEALFRNRCGTCHGRTAVGGLTLATYQDALRGGESGPAIVPRDAEASSIITVQRIGNHPGQLTESELQQVIDWINANAPER
jgi:cytochrome b subunit of formate dehydrogenase/mono/diheme cytochrome c family protein